VIVIFFKFESAFARISSKFPSASMIGILITSPFKNVPTIVFVFTVKSTVNPTFIISVIILSLILQQKQIIVECFLVVINQMV
jgi:hypothetical protein